MLCKNRPVNSRGYSTGGVSIAYRKSHISFKEIILPGNNYEILITEGTMPNFTRKLIAICVYMPPSLSSSSAQGCLGFLVDAVLEIKRKYKDPFISIGGDFNQFDISAALSDYPDMTLVLTKPTRGDRTIDLISRTSLIV